MGKGKLRGGGVKNEDRESSSTMSFFAKIQGGGKEFLKKSLISSF